MPIRRRVLQMVTFVLVLAVQLSPAAQPGPRYLDKETFFHMESIANPKISPDGTQVVFGAASSTS